MSVGVLTTVAHSTTIYLYVVRLCQTNREKTKIGIPSATINYLIYESKRMWFQDVGLLLVKSQNHIFPFRLRETLATTMPAGILILGNSRTGGEEKSLVNGSTCSCTVFKKNGNSGSRFWLINQQDFITSMIAVRLYKC